MCVQSYSTLDGVNFCVRPKLQYFGWRKFLCASKRFVAHTLFWTTPISICPDSDKVLGDAFTGSAVGVANDS